jgi:hypothetical protein
MMVETHTEEERARGMNLDGRRMCGMDLNDGGTVEAHAEEERGTRCEP